MRVGVIGAGLMGAGIAQVSAVAGHEVVLRDLADEALTRAFVGIRTSLAKFVETYDAGGFFWSPFTRPGDGVVTAGEVAKGSMRLTADATAFLELEMHLDGLRPAEREEAIRKWQEATGETCVPSSPAEAQEIMRRKGLL